MRVRIDRQDVEVHRRADIRRSPGKSVVPRRNVQRAVVLQLDQHRELRLCGLSVKYTPITGLTVSSFPVGLK